MLRQLLTISGLQKKWEAIRAEDVVKEPHWIVCGSSVYDISNFLIDHPGGDACLLRRGRGASDCQRDFKFHSRKGQKSWEEYKIGELSVREMEKLEELRSAALAGSSTSNSGGGPSIDWPSRGEEGEKAVTT